MNPLTFWGLLVGAAVVVAYALTAACRKKKAILGTAINLFVTTVGLGGAVRLIGFTLTDQFSKAAKDMSSGLLWNLSPEDAIFIWAGALALSWISFQTIWAGFRDM